MAPKEGGNATLYNNAATFFWTEGWGGLLQKVQTGLKEEKNATYL